MKPKIIDFYITRGNNKNIPIVFKKNNEAVKEKADKVYFSVKCNYKDDEVVFQKTLDNGITFNEETGVYTIELLPNDTNELCFGDYDYDIEIIRNGKVDTPLMGVFKIGKEVTHKCNEV